MRYVRFNVLTHKSKYVAVCGVIFFKTTHKSAIHNKEVGEPFLLRDWSWFVDFGKNEVVPRTYSTRQQ